MTAAVITKVVAFVDATASRVERLVRGGRVRVLSIQCLECGRWVKPDYWNPARACARCARCGCAATARAFRFRCTPWAVPR
jgi:hypothetical protein